MIGATVHHDFARRRDRLQLDSELLNEFLLEAFPNPERVGCPDEGTLKAFAQGILPLNHPTGLHVGSCSECYAEYRHYRRDWQEANRPPMVQNAPAGKLDAAAAPWYAKSRPSRSKGPLLALAASVLIVVGAVFAFRSQHRTGPVVQIASTAPVTASVDLFNAATLRGTGDDAAPLQEVSLPAAMVHLSITLPRFSHPGDYTVAVSNDRTGRQLVAKGEGTAINANGKVALEVTLDLRAAKAGAYFLATVRGSDNGTYYYPLQVK
jgi:hypothetical protein